jgi:amino acid adenylation domain-containing protein
VLQDISLLHEALEVWARQTPDAIAIVEGEQRYCYAQLCDRMERLAAKLASFGIDRNDRIAVLIDNGCDACVAMMGVLRADGCFVPLNPAFPAAYLGRMVSDAQPRAIVTTTRYTALLSEILTQTGDTRIDALVVLDAPSAAMAALSIGFRSAAGADDLAATPRIERKARNREEDLAYILFTSGTTGVPKGVMVNHRSVKSIIGWAVSYFKIRPGDRLSNHSRLSFDVSMFDIFAAFFSGATLYPIQDPGDLRFPGEFIRQNNITIWFSVPNVIGMMAKSRQLMDGPFKSLRAALFAGDILTAEWVELWRKHQPDVPLFNLYGPTEATIVCTVYEVGADRPYEAGSATPIGYANPASELPILKLDEDVEAAPHEIGRLMICGTQLAVGYWRRPDLTAVAFRENPLKRDLNAKMYDTGDLAFKDDAGLIHFVGRLDSQVKVQGYRVELGTIEAGLRAYPGVSEAVVLANAATQSRIIGFVTMINAREGSALEESILAHLDRNLPSYMVPKRIMFLSEMSKTQHGKTDRRQLGDLVSSQ